MATTELSANLSAGFSEPMRESAQFAGIVRSVLRYRILKRVQEEMTRDELEKKRALLEQLERSELEAKRIDAHLEGSSHFPNHGPPPKRSLSTSSAQSKQARAESGDTDSIDSDFPPGHQSSGVPSATQGSPARSDTPSSSRSNSQHRKTINGNFVTNKLFGRFSHAFQGVMDVDPERTRRDQMGKTKESLVHLEQALEVSERDVRDASAGVLRSMKEFQREKEGDFTRYMVGFDFFFFFMSLYGIGDLFVRGVVEGQVAYARAHIEWAKKNYNAWEEAKSEVDAIQLQS